MNNYILKREVWTITTIEDDKILNKSLICKLKVLKNEVTFENFHFFNHSNLHSSLVVSCSSILVPNSPNQVMEEIQPTKYTHKPIKPLQMIVIKVWTR